MPQDVINLVIAAREAFDTGTLPDEENRALDTALEAFSSRVPYENQPDDGDQDACVVCGEHLEDGDPVYWSANDDGHMHAECATSYVDDDGKETNIEPPDASTVTCRRTGAGRVGYAVVSAFNAEIAETRRTQRWNLISCRVK